MRRVRAAKPLHGQVGETLIETLASIVLLAIVAVGVIGSLGSDVIASARDRDTATTESVVRSFAAWVDRQSSRHYHSCTVGSATNPYAGVWTYDLGAREWQNADAPADVFAVPAGTKVQIGAVGFYDPSVASLGAALPTCPIADALVVLTLQAAPLDGYGGWQSIDLVVRRP